MSGAGDPGTEGEVGGGGCLPGLERLNSIMVTSSPRDMAEALAENNFRLFADLLQRHKDSTLAGMVNSADGKVTSSRYDYYYNSILLGFQVGKDKRSLSFRVEQSFDM